MKTFIDKILEDEKYKARAKTLGQEKKIEEKATVKQEEKKTEQPKKILLEDIYSSSEKATQILNEKKNAFIKMRDVKKPYEIWKSRDGWIWRVLKKWQTDDNKKYARWFCAVKSPFTFGLYDMGDVYVGEIKSRAFKAWEEKSGEPIPVDLRDPNPEEIKESSKIYRYKVSLDEKEIEVVSFATKEDPKDVRESLINDDGYNSDIVVSAVNEVAWEEDSNDSIECPHCMKQTNVTTRHGADEDGPYSWMVPSVQKCEHCKEKVTDHDFQDALSVTESKKAKKKPAKKTDKKDKGQEAVKSMAGSVIYKRTNTDAISFRNEDAEMNHCPLVPADKKFLVKFFGLDGKVTRRLTVPMDKREEDIRFELSGKLKPGEKMVIKPFAKPLAGRDTITD